MYSIKSVVERVGDARHEYGAVRLLMSSMCLNVSECKDTSIVNNVFLGRWKFYQKIVFFSSYGLLVVPSQAMPHAFCCYLIFLCHFDTSLMVIKPLIPCHKVIIHDRLIPHLDLVPFL